jgi:hypothetical protein
MDSKSLTVNSSLNFAVFMSRVMNADLRKGAVRTMTEPVARRLGFSRGLLIAMSVSIVAPNALDVVSTKPDQSGSGSVSRNTNNDSFSATGPAEALVVDHVEMPSEN